MAVIALWLVVSVVILAPLPEGSALPWALIVIEVLSLGLFACWQLAVVFGQPTRQPLWFRARPFLLPLALFAVVVMAQLVPLPPALVRMISPATYRLYQVSVPERSEEPSYPGVALRPGDGTRGQPSRPAISEVSRGAIEPKTLGPVSRYQDNFRSTSQPASRWRSLSIDPSMSEGVVLEVAAYVAMFLFIVGYPFGAAGGETETHLFRALLTAALISGLIVAVVGIVEFFTWNGKISWLFVPYDWVVPQAGVMQRASGPFVSPDHFGDYLALVLPLAAAGALFRTDLFSKQRAVRVFSGVTAFLIACALLLSLSRAAWGSAAIALGVLFSLSGRMAEAARPGILTRAHGTILRRAGVIVLVVIALALLFIGPDARTQIDLRLQQTVQRDSDLDFRMRLANETLAMVRAYPVLGVGLGCWPALFPHYRLPPWAPLRFREAHNDYLQLLAEAGALGFVAAAWFFVAIGRRLYRALAKGAHMVSPILGAVCAALTVIVFHEFFDFSLHTPANALLFTVVLALAARMAMEMHASGETIAASQKSGRVAALVMSALAVTLIVGALRQQKMPYPYNLREPKSAGEAIALISAHPSESALHIGLVRLAGETLSAQARLRELYAAVWLDPTNPYTRDVYARALLQEGRTTESLAEISRSVLYSPSLADHIYLRERLIPWLSGPEKKAVERGFQEAVDRGYDGAVYGLAGFYRAQGRFAEAGDTYSRAASVERDRSVHTEYLLGAGLAYAQAGQIDDAQKFLDAAILTEPADDRPYRYLTILVLGPRHQLKAAQEAVAQGVRAGANGPALYDALAEAAQNDGDRQLMESAFRDAVDLRPSFGSLFRLGTFYFDEKKYDRAALTMRRATESEPRSADAYFYLGMAEESDYRFDEAQRDLARAVELAPTNAGYRAHYADFERKVQSGKSAPPQSQ